MKPIVLTGELWIFAAIDDIRPLRAMPLIDIVRAIAERFEFVSGPKALPEKDQGLVFQEGAFRIEPRSIAIQKIEIFNDGTHIVVSSDTTDADRVLSELSRLFTSLGGKDNIQPRLSYHISTIIADFTNPIDPLVNAFSKIADFISSKLDLPAKVQVNNLGFSADPFGNEPFRKGFQNLNPTLFRIERRALIEMERKRYFSIANMTTEHHLEVLQWLDDMSSD